MEKEVLAQIPKNNYPIRFGYINKIPFWWPPQAVAAGMGVPGFAKETLYNYLALAYWSYRLGATDIVSIWADPIKVFGTESQFGSSNQEIQKNLKRRYNDAGIKILISAFGSTELPTTQNIDPIDCADRLGQLVLGSQLDGVDIAWIDNYAMESGVGERWLITFTKKLRQILPNHIITHAPYASYFKQDYFKNGGYVTVEREVGSLINFYNVQFFNQANTKYDNYDQLFTYSTGFFSKTSVKQIISKGIPSSKIVVGKPVIDLDAINSGFMNSEAIGICTERAYKEFGWYTGIMYWEYFSDQQGKSIKNAIGKLIELCQGNRNRIDNLHKGNQKHITQDFKGKQRFILKKPDQKIEVANRHNIQLQKVNYPVRFVYINKINDWWPAQKIVAGLGLPGFANQNIYNYIAFAFWTYKQGPLDIGLIWSNPLYYFGGPTQFGSTNDQIQKNLKKTYNDKGVKIMISAFGATEFPTSDGVNPIECAEKLGKFVLINNLDGVDIDWEDNAAMEAGKGQQWLIQFTKKLREFLPSHIITHAPQAPYFKQQAYKNGAYITVDKQVGSLIDFYNVQFYNQGDTRYESYEALFIKSESYFSGTSVREITLRGVPSQKIIVGKPVTKADVMNSGWVASQQFGNWTSQAYKDFGWYGGVMYWQYVSDTGGNCILNAVGYLKEICAQDKKCH